MVAKLICAISGVPIRKNHKISSSHLLLAIVLSSGMAMPFDAVAQSEGIYLSGALGAVWPQDAEFVGTGTSAEASFHPGLFGSLALGTTFGDIWRSDVELSYRASDVGELSGVANGSGEVNGSAAMINGYYDLFSGSDLRPYLGGGIGIMRLIADGVSPIGGSTIDDEDTVVAVQGVAGVGYRVNDWLGLFTDYRFLATTETEFTTVAGRPLNWEYREHRIVVGLRWSFGGAEFDRQKRRRGLWSLRRQRRSCSTCHGLLMIGPKRHRLQNSL